MSEYRCSYGMWAVTGPWAPSPCGLHVDEAQFSSVRLRESPRALGLSGTGLHGARSPGPKDLLSDRCVLSCPSMDLVTCLLDFRLNLASNRSIVPRLAASLAACAQLSALGRNVFTATPGSLDGKRGQAPDVLSSFQLPVTGCGPFRDCGGC